MRPTGETFTLTTIGDLVNIPSERLEACLRDIQYSMELGRLLFGEELTPETFGPFTWTDDGLHNVRATFPNGDAYSLEVTESEDQ